ALAPPPPRDQPGVSYVPITGKGGDGSVQGGVSGSIGIAGVAGKGGKVIIEAMLPTPKGGGLRNTANNINLDRIVVDGGGAGTEPVIDDPHSPVRVTLPASDGVERGDSR